jgi:hypothetical protein
MDARYEGPNLSRFLSEDPNFINAGAPDWVTGMPLDLNYAALPGFVNSTGINYLANPQNLNAYSYVDNDPLKYVDPDGKQLAAVPIILGAVAIYGYAQSAIDAYTLYVTNFQYASQFSTEEKISAATNVGVDLATSGISYGAKAFANFKGLGTSLDIVGAGSSILDTLKQAAERNVSFKKRDQSIQDVLPIASSNVNRSAGSGGYSYSTPNSLNTNFFSSNTQTRYQAVQRYNTSGGYSAPQTQLWVTPNGAVVTWSGSVVAPAPSAKR